MASPNNNPIVITGRNASNGPVFSIPNKLPIKPCWMTNVVKPNVAINERINPSTAFNGTKIERNTIINKKNANTTITPANTGIALFSFSDISMLITLCPEISVP